MKANLHLVIICLLLISSCSTDDNRDEDLPEEEIISKEIFFSEYLEGTSFNKALEIVNLTGQPIDLTAGEYSIKKQSNGSGNWMSDIPLSGIVGHEEVFVVANELADDPDILSNANQIKTGAPMDFNGNDPIGLFKNNILIDVIGNVDSAEEFGKDINLRRKAEVKEPSTTFDPEEWEQFDMANTEDLGKY